MQKANTAGEQTRPSCLSDGKNAQAEYVIKAPGFYPPHKPVIKGPRTYAGRALAVVTLSR